MNDILLEKGLLYVRKGKGNKERYVPFTAGQQRDFKNYLNYCRPRLVKENKKEEAFLLNNYGRRITYNNALSILKTLQQNESIHPRQNWSAQPSPQQITQKYNI